SQTWWAEGCRGVCSKETFVPARRRACSPARSVKGQGCAAGKSYPHVDAWLLARRCSGKRYHARQKTRSRQSVVTSNSAVEITSFYLRRTDQEGRSALPDVLAA